MIIVLNYIITNGHGRCIDIQKYDTLKLCLEYYTIYDLEHFVNDGWTASNYEYNYPVGIKKHAFESRYFINTDKYEYGEHLIIDKYLKSYIRKYKINKLKDKINVL